jgi:hypothetical protein
MSAFSGKADIGLTPCNVRFRPKADMRSRKFLLCKITIDAYFACRKGLVF